MGSSIFATVVIVTILFLILASLGFALFYLLAEENGSRSTLMALQVRVALSMTLFLGLLTAIHMGWIIPNPPPL